MLRRLINLPLTVANKAAKAFQDREDAKMREKYGETRDPGDVAVSASPSSGPVLSGTVDPVTCRMDAADALAALRSGKPVAFVDVRDTRARATVPGAVSMPLGEVNIRVSELPPDQLVIAFCDDGVASARAVAFFREREMEDTWWIAGGLAAWRTAGGPTEPVA